MNLTFRLSLALLFINTFLPEAAFAQAVRAPSVTDPGQVGQRLRIEEERPDVGGASIITLPDENGKQKKLASNVTFELKGIVFENLTAFKKEDLRQDYINYIGKDISLITLNQIAAKITAHYRNAGYILSRAVVPPQKINGGIVKIRIVEGHINKVILEGVPEKGDLIGEYANKIRDARPLDAATLERYLLLMEDLSGVSAHAVIRPSAAEPGASDIVVTVAQKNIDGSATLDNRGTRYMGPVQAGLTINANNMLGVYDHTQIHGAITPDITELKYGQIVHEEQLDSEGTKLALSASHTHTHPGYKISQLDITGDDTLYSAAISHPFLRSRQSNLFGNAQFDIRDTNSNALDGTDKLYDDHLRVLRGGGSYDFVDGWLAVNRFETQLSKGLNWDTGRDGDPRSRSTGRPDFLKGTGLISRLQPLDGPFGLYVSGTGQWSANTLLSAEQFSLGGPAFGSAYDPAEIVGDSGIAGRVELQYSRSGDFEVVPNYQLYTFYDIGQAWTRNALAGQKSTASLASAGGGVRFNILEPISGALEVAVPLTKLVAANGQNGDSPRVFFSLAYRY